MGNKKIIELENFELNHEIEEVLAQVGWPEFINNNEVFDPRITVEFILNFHVNVTRVGGEIIEVTPQVISEIYVISLEGESINKGHTNFEEVVSLFHEGDGPKLEL